MRKLALTLILFTACFLPSRLQAQQVLSAASTDCTTTSSCAIVDVDNRSGAATFTVSSNSGGNTIQFEGTSDPAATNVSGLWVALSSTPSSSATGASSTTSTGTWQFNPGAYRKLRMRMSTLSSGTTTVNINQSTASARSGGGGSSFNPAAPGPIGGTTPAAGHFTTLDATSGITATADGVHAGYENWVGNTANQAVTANTAGFMGPNLATFTAYALQLPSVGPTAVNTLLNCGALVSSVSPCSFSPGPATFTSVNSVVKCDAMSGATADVKIAACIAALPAAGGVADARGITGAQSIAATIALKAGTKLLLGQATYTTAVTPAITYVSNDTIEGIGWTSQIVGNVAGPIIDSANHSVAYNDVHILNLQINDTSSANAGSYDIDFYQTTDSTIANVIATHAAVGIYVNGAGSCSCYNVFTNNFTNSDVTGIEFLNQSNSNSVIGGTANAVTDGLIVDLSDSLRVHGLDVEAFTGSAFSIAPTGATFGILLDGPRAENGSPAGNGVLIGTSALETVIIDEDFQNMSVDVADNSTLKHTIRMRAGTIVTANLLTPSVQVNNAAGGGSVTQTYVNSASTPAVAWGTSSGTPVVAASLPLTVNATTGNLTLATSVYNHSCDISLGNGSNSIPAGTYPFVGCKNDTGATITITGVQCYTDSGTSSCDAKTSHSGTPDILTGTVNGTTTFAAGAQSATTTILNGEWLTASLVLDGTTKQIIIHVIGTL